MPNITCSHKTLNLEKHEIQKKSFEFRTLRWTSFFNDTTLYHEHIDRPKFSEQKTHLSI